MTLEKGHGSTAEENNKGQGVAPESVLTPVIGRQTEDIKTQSVIRPDNLRIQSLSVMNPDNLRTQPVSNSPR